jgi:hypothetical protein
MATPSQYAAPSHACPSCHAIERWRPGIRRDAVKIEEAAASLLGENCDGSFHRGATEVLRREHDTELVAVHVEERDTVFGFRLFDLRNRIVRRPQLEMTLSVERGWRKRDVDRLDRLGRFCSNEHVGDAQRT